MLDPEYVRGFIDAEGCFYYNELSRSNNSSFRLYNKNIDILNQIKEFFGCGYIYKNNHGTYRNVHEFVMQSKDQLRVLIKFLEKYPPIIKQTNRPRNRNSVKTFEEWIDITKHYIDK